MEKISIPRGTQDFIAEDAFEYKTVTDKFSEISSIYNFNLIFTPIFERESLFLRPLGEDSDIVNKEMYSFKDKSGDSITLRPEGTAPVIRSIVENHLYEHLPMKFSYFGPMFRYERPQKGRFRQFHQLGCELISGKDFLRDVEVIKMATDFISSLNIKDYTLCINSLGDLESSKKYRNILKEYFSEHFNSLSEISKMRFQKNPLRILDSKEDEDQEIIKNAPSMISSMNLESREYYEKVKIMLKDLGVSFVEDEMLVRGLDYYTHTVFEFKSNSLGAQGTFLAGGRYDNLLEMLGGPSISGIGWAAGFERLKLLYNLNLKKEIFVIVISDEVNSGMVVLNYLRENHIKSEVLIGDSFKNLMKKAIKKFPDYVIFIGEDERSKGILTLKNLNENSQIEFKLEKLFELKNFIK